MRAAALLQKIRRLDGSALGAGVAYDLGTAQGARALGVRAGDLTEGCAADFVVLDASAIEAWTPPVNALVYRGSDAWVQATFVGGRRVYAGSPSHLADRARIELAKVAGRVVP
jgi:5-methylthioadenosine/S-adenosylhomocysteine deaminase